MSQMADLQGVVRSLFETQKLTEDECAALLVEICGALEWDISTLPSPLPDNWYELEKKTAYDLLFSGL